MFRNKVDSNSCHFIFRKSALLGMSLCADHSLGAMHFLFITNATPAVEHGEVGSTKNIISILLPKL